jgi:hypothetical protein
MIYQITAALRLGSVPFLVLSSAVFAVAQASSSISISAQTSANNNRQAVSLGDELRRPGNEPLHLLYVHGIGATGPGDSAELRDSICKHVKQYLKQECVAKKWQFQGREYADEGIFNVSSEPPTLTYMGSRVRSRTVSGGNVAGPCR